MKSVTCCVYFELKYLLICKRDKRVLIFHEILVLTTVFSTLFLTSNVLANMLFCIIYWTNQCLILSRIYLFKNLYYYVVVTWMYIYLRDHSSIFVINFYILIVCTWWLESLLEKIPGVK